MEDAIAGCKTAGKKAFAILPVGSLEQHGPVLPVESDSIISEAISRKVAQELISRGYFCYSFPPVFYSPVKSNMNYKGSVTVEEDTFRRYIREICLSLFKNSFDAVIIVSGHGPADPSINEVAFNIVNQQFESPESEKRPVIVLTMGEVNAIIQDKLNYNTGKHADWREFLLLYQLLGETYFTEKRMDRLKELSTETPKKAIDCNVLGIPLTYRSNQGIIGEPLLPSTYDIKKSADIIWKSIMDYYINKVINECNKFWALTGYIAILSI